MESSPGRPTETEQDDIHILSGEIICVVKMRRQNVNSESVMCFSGSRFYPHKNHLMAKTIHYTSLLFGLVVFYEVFTINRNLGILLNIKSATYQLDEGDE